MNAQADQKPQPQPPAAKGGKLDPDDALEKAMNELRSVAQDDDGVTADPAPASAAATPAGRLSHTLREIPLEVQAVIGRADMSVAQLNALRSGATIPLDSRVGDPVDIIINGVRVATGQMQMSEDDPDRFAFKVISVCS